MNRIFTFCRGKTFTRVNYLFSSWKRDKRIQLKENSLCNGCLCIPCSAGLETIILFWLSRSKSGRFRSKSISNKCSVHQGFNLAAQTIFNRDRPRFFDQVGQQTMYTLLRSGSEWPFDQA